MPKNAFGRKLIVAMILALCTAVLFVRLQSFAAPTADQTAITNATVSLFHSDPLLTISEAIVSSTGVYGLTTYQIGESGGQAIWKKTSGLWRLIVKGGGVYDACLMVGAGVPSADAISLMSQSVGSSAANRLTHCALVVPTPKPSPTPTPSPHCGLCGCGNAACPQATARATISPGH